MWWPFKRKTVRVTMVDARSGQTYKSRVPPEQLPETFAGLETTMYVEGRPFIVIEADPKTRLEYATSGRLHLSLHPIESMALSKILYSLPTVGSEWAATEGEPGPGACTIEEDEWRQMEFVGKEHRSQLELEFAAIREIYATQRSGDFFKRTHGRAELPRPLGSGVPVDGLPERLHAAAETDVAIWTGNSRGKVVGGFAFQLPGGGWVYGVREGDRVTVLGLSRVDEATARATAGVLGDQYLLVDWLGADVLTSRESQAGGDGDGAP